MFMEGKKPASKLAAIAATIAIWVIAAGPARAAEAQAKPACGTSITACGCTINSGGNYTVANNLDATQGLTNKGDCIDISAPFAQLNVRSFSIIGNRTGVGINVLSTAHHTIIEGAAQGSSENGQGVINGWNIGVLVAANNTIVELFNPIGGTEASPQGNVAAGIEVDNVTDCTIDDIISSYNGTSGVSVNNSSRIRIFNLTASNNGGSGILMQSSSTNTLSNMTAGSNGQYGLLLLHSDQNQIFTLGVADNGAAGISIGCEAGGPVACTGNQPSSKNKVSNLGARTNGRAGIVVNNKSSNNQITVITATGNKGNADLVDGNPNCDKNQWFNNSFGSASPSSCIQ